MADWTTIDTNSLLPGEPWTSNKALAAFENPQAIAEDATGAPKIVRKMKVQTLALTPYTNLDEYGGIEFTYVLRAENPLVNLAYSTDNGSTWSSNQVIGSIDTGGTPYVIRGEGYFDFATGKLVSFAHTAFFSDIINTTVAGASLSINAIRISAPSFIKPTGGIGA